MTVADAPETAEKRPKPLAEAVRLAWPDGVAADDDALLRRLSLEEERLLAGRLSALLEVEAGLRPASRAPADDARNLTDSGFQSLVRRWRVDRRLRTLMPYDGRSVRRRGDTPGHRAVVEAVDGLLKVDPGMGLLPLSREAARRAGVDLAPNSVKLIARERRAALRLDGGWLAARYGATVVADVCALAAEMAAPSGEARAAVIALVVEGASGIVLGHAAGSADAALELQRGAMADAFAGIVAARLDVLGGDPSLLKVVVAPWEDAATLDYARALRQALPQGEIVDTPRRRAGDRVADLLDGAIGILRLRPRGGRPTRRATAKTWDEARLIDMAADAVAAHNDARIALLRAALPDDHLTSLGRMSEALRPVVALG